MKKGNVSVFSAHKRARGSLRGSHMAVVLFALSLLSFFAFCGAAAFLEGVFAVLAKSTPMKAHVGYLLALSCSLLFVLFLIAPLWRGMHALSLGFLLYGQMDYGALFCFFSAKKRYLFAVRASFSALLRLIIFLASLFLTLRFGRALASDLFTLGDTARAVLVLSLTVLFCVLLAFSHLYISLQGYLLDAVAVSAPLLRYRQMKAVSKCAMRGRYGVVLRHRLCFFLYAILSLICLGIPLVFVLPYRFVAKDALALKLLEK